MKDANIKGIIAAGVKKSQGKLHASNKAENEAGLLTIKAASKKDISILHRISENTWNKKQSAMN